MGEPVFIVGLPLTGKSTLGATIARLMPKQWHHICIGDLVRADRAAAPLSWQRLERCYSGDELFPASYLASLLRRAVIEAQVPWSHCIIDGGCPLGEVASLLGLDPTLTITVSASEEMRRERFERRRRSGSREDDLDDLFTRRTALYSRELPTTLRTLAGLGPLIHIDGNQQPSSVLRESLSALSLVATARGGSVEASTVEHLVERASAVTLQSPDTRVRVTPATPSSHSFGVSPILLIKPGLRFGPPLLEAVARRVAAHGLRVAEFVLRPGMTVWARALARAHFDKHDLYSRFASVLLGDETIGGHQFHDDPFSVLRAWEAGVPQKRRNGLWMHRTALPGSDAHLVNGHMPAVLAEFEDPNSQVIAVRLAYRSEPPPGSWRQLRERLLGSTDPQKALPDSLRGAAYAGRLPLEGRRVSFQNNGFHLSAGPLEALRERLIWFGTTGQPWDPGFRAQVLRLSVDSPIGETTSFEATEGRSWKSAGMTVATAVLRADLDFQGRTAPQRRHILSRIASFSPS